MPPTVSVIIPAYNQGQYLQSAVRSALAQTYEHVEVLVVDDGSTDDTRVVATGFNDPRVRYIYQKNRGLATARNTGLHHATGQLFTFLDSDDLFLPEKLRLLMAALDADPRLGFVAGQAVLIDEAGNDLGEVFERALPEDASELLLGNPLHVGSVLLRREWQERVGGFDETLRSYEDWDMWLRLARAGCPMGWVARPVSLYRFHRAQMTRIGQQMTTATFTVLEKTFKDPDLPASWRLRRDEAYSRAYLRAAAQAYTAVEFPRAKDCMREAVRLNPRLTADNAEPVARVVAGWANHVKTRDPMAFLVSIYENLPEELGSLYRRRQRDLAGQAMQMAFAAHRRGDGATARTHAFQAVRRQPHLLLNRGVLSILLTINTRGGSQVAMQGEGLTAGTGSKAVPAFQGGEKVMVPSPVVLRFQATPFVILFVERAGSTYLITALKSHPEVLALTEKLDALRQEGKTAAEQLEWARSFLTPPLIGRHRAIGFKTKLVDVLDRDGFARLLRERGCKIVQLQRRNAVKAVVSTLNAKRQWKVSGNWNLLSESTRLEPFVVDPDEFDALLHERERLDTDLAGYVDQLELPTLKLFYEDLLLDEKGFVGKTLDFLHGGKRTAPGATLKNTGDDLRQAIVNFDQLRTRYSGTRYESMFDEVLLTA